MAEDSTVAAIGCIGVIPALVIHYVARGCVLQVLWGWFLTPIFHIPVPGIAYCLGIGILIGYLSGVSTPDTNTQGNKSRSVVQIITELYAKLLMEPFLILGIGWVIHHYV